MFEFNYKLAIASLLKQKGNTLINILGLTAGFVCFLFILLFVKDELNYDKHHEKASRIYRVLHTLDFGDSGENSVSCPFPVGPALMDEYPDMIESYTRMFNWWGESYTLKYEDRVFNESRFVYVDSSFFNVFTYDFIAGNPETALDGPYKVVITESTAKKYFGNVADAMNKMLKVNNEFSILVTGVIRDMPLQGHFEYDFISSLSTFRAQNGGNIDWWWANPAWTYIVLKKNTSSADLKSNLPSFRDKYVPTDWQDKTDFDIQPLLDIHLKSHLNSEIRQNGNVRNIFILSAIAIIVIILACINYISLSTVISSLRSKEIGIRKVLGSARRYLITQFISESFILMIVSFVLSFIILLLLLPAFNNLTGKVFSFNDLIQSTNLIWMVLIVIVASILSGLYPAFYLTSLSPLVSIRGEGVKSSGNLPVRRILVLLQFVLSIFMIMGSLTILKQLSYLRNKDLAFDKEDVLILKIKNTPLKKNFYAFEQELMSVPAVRYTTFLECIPGNEFYKEGFYPEGLTEDQQKQLYNFSRVHYNYAKTLGIKIVSGRDFANEYESEPETAILINEAMVRHLGWTNDNAIGKKFHFYNQERVIGVMKDFNYHTLHSHIEPLVIDLVREGTGQHDWATNHIAIKLANRNTQTAINDINKAWNKFAPDFPMDYTFLEDNLRTAYSSEEKISRISGIFTFIAILLACLGVFGLFKYTIERKIRDIAIRKVLGSNVPNIILLLVTEFLWLVGIASLVAIPLSWVFLIKWLQNYNYAISLSPVLIILTLVFILIPPFLIIVYQSFKAARTNPVVSLKNE